MATPGMQMEFKGVQNATFDENPHENERIRVILGCAIGLIACAKHRCMGGWLKLWVGAAPTGDAPTTSEWSTILLPTSLRLILEV